MSKLDRSRYTEKQIADATSWTQDHFGALSQETFDKRLDQVLQAHYPSGSIEDIEFDIFAQPQLGFEDSVVERLITAVNLGEINLNLNDTLEGKTQDVKVIQDFLKRNAAYYPHETRDEWLRENGGVTSDGSGTLWFEYPGDGMSDINPPQPSERHAVQLVDRLTRLSRSKGVMVKVHPDHLVMLEKVEPLQLVMSNESIKKRLVGPWDGEGWDKGMDEATRTQRMEIDAGMRGNSKDGLPPEYTQMLELFKGFRTSPARQAMHDSTDASKALRPNPVRDEWVKRGDQHESRIPLDNVQTLIEDSPERKAKLAEVEALPEGGEMFDQEGKRWTKVHGRMVPEGAVQMALASIHLDPSMQANNLTAMVGKTVGIGQLQQIAVRPCTIGSTELLGNLVDNREATKPLLAMSPLLKESEYFNRKMQLVESQLVVEAMSKGLITLDQVGSMQFRQAYMQKHGARWQVKQYRKMHLLATPRTTWGKIKRPFAKAADYLIDLWDAFIKRP